MKRRCSKLSHNAVKTLKIADNSALLSLLQSNLNPLDYSIWSVLQEKVYRSKITDVDELKTRLMDEWAQFDQSIVDAAISQWRRRLSACVRVRGAHFEHKFLQF